MQTAKRLEKVKEYYFSRKLKEIARLKSAGYDVLNLSIGSPDLPPHPSVIKSLQDAAISGPNGYQSYQGLPELRGAISDFYKSKYNVAFNPEEEVLPLMGSKEGITHVSLAYLNPQENVLVPELSYPTYQSVTEMVDANVIKYPLLPEKAWEPDWSFFDQLKGNPKVLWINYPHMPTGAKGELAWLEKFVTIAKHHKMLLVHDNPYSFILNEEPHSIFNIAGAKEVAVELNSLSKTFNMAGWRVGWVCGKAKLLQPVLSIRSNMDSGMYYGIQKAAITAMKLDDEWYQRVNDTYRKRRDKVFELLDLLRCKYDKKQQGMFVWAKVTSGTGESLVDELLQENHVFITPGNVFGEAGKEYVRVSLCSPKTIFEQAIDRIRR